MSGQIKTAGAIPVDGCTKYASQFPSGVGMTTSDSIVGGRTLVSPVVLDGADVVEFVVEFVVAFVAALGADAPDLHATSESPAPTESAANFRRDKTSCRSRYATMSSNESSSHMRAIKRAHRIRNKRNRS